MKKVFLFTVLVFVAVQLFASRMDEGRTDYAYIRSAEASSTYSEWLSGKEVIYDALNVLDGKADTIWCEDKYDSGIGEYLTITFETPIIFDEIWILNGFSHKDYYKKNNRVKSLNIGFLDGDIGSTGDFTLEDDGEKYQSIKLEEPVLTTAVVFTITDVYRGEKYDDTCIGEIIFRYKGSHIRYKNVETLKSIKENHRPTGEHESALFKKIHGLSKKTYQTVEAKYNGVVFLAPQHWGDKGYVILFYNGEFNSIHPCWFYSIAGYKNEIPEDLWQWTANPEIYIYDYDCIAVIDYETLGHGEMEFIYDSGTDSIHTEQRLYNGIRGFWHAGYEITYYLTDKGNYIDINGNEYEILDASKVFVDLYEWYRP